MPLEARPRFEIVDSKVWASGISQFPPQWADLHTVLFHTGPEFRVRDADWSLAIWDVRGKPRIYRPNVHAYCVRDGFIVYFVPEDVRGIRGTWYAGKLGEEKPIRQDSEEDTARLYDPINCKVAAVKELRERAAKTNRAIVWLLDGHGFLDLGALLGPESMLNTPVRYFRADARAASAVTLPFGRREIRR
ncbi:MAG: hypothetical protein N2653_01160, partial [Burkholderiales bacterium]|nr:hypothetical protein [Burkholderiales bacterium]